MSVIGSWLWGTSQIDDAVDKATSEMLPSGAEDIALNLEICDQIRSKTAPANLAMRALKRRLNHKNPNVQLLALGLTDICVKNGGDHFLTEIASREFMDNLVSILKIPVLNIEVKNTILRLVQNWSIAFEGKPSLSYVSQVYKTLNNEGFKFPPRDLTAANAAMVDTQTAPEWIDSEVCLRCRTPFTFTNRKHHCRNCGQVFDQQCSSKAIPLPHFGITQEVRVCDGCYSKLTKKGERVDKTHRHSQSLHSSARHRSARELADAELQRAIELSLEESRSANGYRPGYVASQPDPSRWQTSEPPIVDHSTHPPRRSKSLPLEDQEDEDLRAAIEASLQEASAPKASAPDVLPTPQSEYPPQAVLPQPTIKLPNYDLQPVETDAILRFSEQMDQAQESGRSDVLRNPAVTSLYESASGLRGKLAMSLDDTGKKEQLLTEMHDKMSQIVKLYDGLLSAQLSRPRWRTQSIPTAPQQQYQQANSVYSMGYNPQAVNGYSQWNQVQTPTTTEPHSQPAQTQPTWYSQPQSQTVESAPSQAYPQSEPPQPIQTPTMSNQQFSQPGPSYLHMYTPSQEYSQLGSSQPQVHQPEYSNPNNLAQPPHPQLPHQVQPPTASLQTTFSQYQSQLTPTTQTTSQSYPISNPVLLQPNQPPLPSASIPAPPTQYSPPAAAAPMMTPSLPPTSTGLSRQNTISTYHPQASLSPTNLASLQRHNTVHSPVPPSTQISPLTLTATSMSPPPSTLHSTRSSVVSNVPSLSQQQIPVLPPASVLPVFPTAPTATPQVFSQVYSPPQPQTEREAMLIEL